MTSRIADPRLLLKLLKGKYPELPKYKGHGMRIDYPVFDNQCTFGALIIPIGITKTVHFSQAKRLYYPNNAPDCAVFLHD
jgi:hypothetical protein